MSSDARGTAHGAARAGPAAARPAAGRLAAVQNTTQTGVLGSASAAEAAELVSGHAAPQQNVLRAYGSNRSTSGS